MRTKIKTALFLSIFLLGVTSILQMTIFHNGLVYASHLSEEEATEKYDGWVTSECHNRIDDTHEREVCIEYASGTPATSDTTCTINGEEGFITSNPFGDQGEDYVPIAGQENKYCVASQQGNDPTTNPIFTLLNTIIDFISAGIFIVGILMITVSGIQYITARGNPEATKAARGRIGKVVLGLFLYFFFVAIMQFLVPGGVFN